MRMNMSGLVWLIKAYRDLAGIAEQMRPVCGDSNMLDMTLDELTDGLCILGGDDRPVTENDIYRMLNDKETPVDECAKRYLAYANRETKRAPVFFTPEQIARMQEVLGGYRYDAQ